MANIKKDNIISFMTYKQSMLCKTMAYLLIFTFTITNLAYGFDRSDINHLRRIRNPESDLANLIETSFATHAQPQKQNPKFNLQGWLQSRLRTSAAEEENPTVQELIGKLRHENRDVRKDVAMMLGEMGPTAEKAIEELCDLVRRMDGSYGDIYSGASEAARDALVKIGPTTIPRLRWHLADESNPDRKPFAEALSQFGEEVLRKFSEKEWDKVVRVLVSIMDSYQEENEWYRMTIIWTLATIGKSHPNTAPALMKAIKTDQNRDVRGRAIYQLSQVLGMDSIEFFVREMNIPHSDSGFMVRRITDFGFDAIPVLLEIEKRKPGFNVTIEGLIYAIARENTEVLVKYVLEHLFNHDDNYDVALQRTLDWSSDELEDRWTDLQMLLKGLKRWQRKDFFNFELCRLKKDFRERENRIWPAYMAFIKKVKKGSKGSLLTFSKNIRELSRCIASENDLLSLGDDLLMMEAAAGEVEGFVAAKGIPLLLKGMTLPSGLDYLPADGDAKDAFNEEWSRSKRIIMAYGARAEWLVRHPLCLQMALWLGPDDA